MQNHTHSQDDSHHHDHDHHNHHHESASLWQTIGAVLHLPGFGHGHSHDHTDLAADNAIYDNQMGIRAVWLSLLILAATTVLQIVVYLASGSVALLADTVHNFGDALNSVPLLAAFYLARRVPTQRYTYGFGRAEDVAGILIVVSIAFSASYIMIESFQKLLDPKPLTNLPWVASAAVIGLIGNELVAAIELRVGRQIGSDAMIADGQHARVDGLTSLAVLIAVVGTAIGLPILDPLVGLLIGLTIVGITWNATKAVWYRLMDGVDPQIVAQMQHIADETDGVRQVVRLRVHWVGHRLYANILLIGDNNLSLAESHTIAQRLLQSMRRAIPHLEELVVQILPETKS